jgi:hypothetical protein
MTKPTTETPIHDTVEATRHFVQEATTIARQTTEHNMQMSQQLAEIWTTSVEANMKAAFDLQNAAIAASRSLMEATGSQSPTFFQQWTDMVHQAQQATLDAWKAGKRVGEQFQKSTK